MGAFIRNMPAVMFYLILAFAIGAAIALVVVGRKSRRRAALVQAMPTANIGMVADGYCEFEGRAEAAPGPPLLTPLTRQPCAWYHAEVQRYVGGRKKGSDGWATIKDSTSSAPFLLRDSTGVCAVHPYNADITATDKSVWYGATPIPTERNPPKVGPTEQAEGMVTIAGTPNRKFRYFEERIYLGDPLLVLGMFSRGRDTADPDEDDELDGDDDDQDHDEDALEANYDDPPENAEEAALDKAWNDDALVEDLSERIAKVTPAWVSQSTDAKPFIISTSLQAVEIAHADMGGKAAMQLALAPAAIALLLLYARFG